jgi:hypothetical protein
MAETANDRNERLLIERRVRRAQRSLDLFTPWQRLSRQMALSVGVIEDRLATAEELLQEGRSVTDVFRLLNETVIGDHSIFFDPVRAIVRSALIAGYNDGAHYQGKIPRAGFVNSATIAATQRDTAVDRQMAKTTKRQLRKSSDPDRFILSGDRATRAVRYEAAVHYNKGLLLALIRSNLTKSWITTGDKPCPVCIENEDAGFIEMGQEFPSGDLIPLAHLNCQCVLTFQ